MIPAWSVGLIVRVIEAAVKHRRDRKARAKAIAAIQKEVPQMDGVLSVLQWVWNVKFLEGYRGKVAGGGLFFSGLGALICNLAGCDTHGVSPSAAVLMMGNGLGILGIHGRLPEPK